jgi:transketolase
MSVLKQDIETLAINTIRTLSMDAVEAANSGHPGTPMALAPVAYVVYNEFLRYDPDSPGWMGRDRFVLSCGHASMLLYSILHLVGVKRRGETCKQPGDGLAVTLDDIRRFRQLDSRCPGHPEHGFTDGVETTTGPLGQGVANSVGMAIASRWLSARYGRPGFEDLFDYSVYALCSDGDLMEGVSAEAASLAGHLKLANLCWIYDDNKITIEGNTSLAFSECVKSRFTSYGWNVVEVADVNDLAALRKAIEAFQATKDRPTLIVVRSVIAWGSPNKANTHGAHGAPLGAEEIRLAKAAYGWPENESFLVPEQVTEHFQAGIGRRGKKLHEAWTARYAKYKETHPELAEQVKQIMHHELPAGWDAEIPAFPADAKGIASRASSGKVLNAVAKRVPWLLGGSADLAPSTNTLLTFEGAGDQSAANPGGRNFHFGIREHGMGSILNGMALCGLRPYGATFFVFADYMRPPIRLASIMELPVIYVFTHDSIGVGEDGPTHQPIEQLASLRAIPGLTVIRPADANEVAEAYRVALPRKHGPVALILTRQNLPTLDRTKYAPASGLARGGYILADAPGGLPEVILIGTGSEVELCVAACEKLAAEGVKARVVSMPSWDLFDAQPLEYRNTVLPPTVAARVGVELGVEMGWCKYLGPRGRFVGMSHFGASAPIKVLMKHFGITADAIVAQAKAALAGS